MILFIENIKILYLIKKINNSVVFMLGSLTAKIFAAFAQLYAVFIFAKIHIADDASVIFLLLGYGIWFQVFELGISQTLQNRLNSNKSGLVDAFIVICAHYLLMLLLAIFIISSDIIPGLLLPLTKDPLDSTKFMAFSFGMALMVISINNVIMQRLLLVLNKGWVANNILVIQSIFIIIALQIYGAYGEINIINSVLVYLVPQVIVYMPLICKIIQQIIKKYRYRRDNLTDILKDSVGFWTINLMSLGFLGADYYFIAHFLSSDQIVSYHITSRFFFLSFVAYYSYVLHRARFIKFSSTQSNPVEFLSIIKKSIFIGVASVLFAALIFVSGNYIDIFSYLMGGYQIEIFLLLSAGIYFLIRVFRDVGVVLIGNLGNKFLLYKVYLFELIIGIFLLNLSIRYNSGIAIFAAMAVTCFLSTCLIYAGIRKSMKIAI